MTIKLTKKIKETFFEVKRTVTFAAKFKDVSHF